MRRQETWPQSSDLAYTSKSLKAKMEIRVHEDYPKKEKLFTSFKQEEVIRIVDTSIRLVSTIETLINGKPQNRLRDRSGTGLFAHYVFG